LAHGLKSLGTPRSGVHVKEENWALGGRFSRSVGGRSIARLSSQPRTLLLPRIEPNAWRPCPSRRTWLSGLHETPRWAQTPWLGIEQGRFTASGMPRGRPSHQKAG
jgi:hypothetical protein